MATSHTMENRPSAVEQEVRALEAERWRAMHSFDLPVLEALFHEELIYTHASTLVEDKVHFMARFSKDQRRMGSIKHFKRTEESFRLYGDTALITGSFTLGDGAQPGVPETTAHRRFLSVWTKTPQGWKFVAYQSANIPQ